MTELQFPRKNPIPPDYWQQKDIRTEWIQATNDYVKNQQTTKENARGFGEGVPDLSSFAAFLTQSQDMPLQTFLESHDPERKGKYVSSLSFDPLSATFFDLFMDPTKRPFNDHFTPVDFSLSPEQLEAYKQNGLVVTTKEESFAKAYYTIYNNDLPVLITADSILHAFHKSYDMMLKDVEMNFCVQALENVIIGMRNILMDSHPNFVNGPLEQSYKDVDFFLTVGFNLLKAENWSGNTIATILGNGNETVANALQACKAERKFEIELFGKEREVDFSLFKPRGHYTKTPLLRQYFRTMTWLGNIDMRVAGDGSNEQQIGAAVVLQMLLVTDKKIEKIFLDFCRLIEALAGPVNSMDVRQLGFLLNEVFKMKDYRRLNSPEALATLQTKILQTDLGAKNYNLGNFRSFSFLGLKFTIDNWAQSKVITNDSLDNVANQIFWNGEKVNRHSTSAVEIAFSVFGNDDATSTIHQRISDPNPTNIFRDGLIYHPYLEAARATVDQLPKEAWCTSIYSYWMLALRKLSTPMDEQFPEAMRTKAYAMKNMTTQLSSWAQIRHDNILYVEQGGRFVLGCSYPDGFVEPFVEFWEAIENLCMATVEVLNMVVPLTDRIKSVILGQKFNLLGNQKRTDFTKTQEFFIRFAKHVHVLRDISVLELAQQPLTAQQTLFLKTVVEQKRIGSGGEVKWTGWYPNLFYGGETDCIDSDLLICDTYTNPPSELPFLDPGCVVHQGVSYPRRMTIAINNGKEIRAYAGPVYDYYEFELSGIERWNDEQWKAKVKEDNLPLAPEWTSSYRLPPSPDVLPPPSKRVYRPSPSPPLPPPSSPSPSPSPSPSSLTSSASPSSPSSSIFSSCTIN